MKKNSRQPHGGDTISDIQNYLVPKLIGTTAVDSNAERAVEQGTETAFFVAAPDTPTGEGFQFEQGKVQKWKTCNQPSQVRLMGDSMDIQRQWKATQPPQRPFDYRGLKPQPPGSAYAVLHGRMAFGRVPLMQHGNYPPPAGPAWPGPRSASVADDDEMWLQLRKQHSEEMTMTVERARQRRAEEEKYHEQSKQYAQEKAKTFEKKDVEKELDMDDADRSRHSSESRDDHPPSRDKRERDRSQRNYQIPESAVVMPDDAVTSLDVQFGALHFGTDSSPFDFTSLGESNSSYQDLGQHANGSSHVNSQSLPSSITSLAMPSPVTMCKDISNYLSQSQKKGRKTSKIAFTPGRFGVCTRILNEIGLLTDVKQPKREKIPPKDSVFSCKIINKLSIDVGIILDGSNIARTHGQKRNVFSVRGLAIAAKFCLDQGFCPIRIILPLSVLEQTENVPITDYELLDNLKATYEVTFIGYKIINQKICKPYDDRVILELSKETGDLIVSNDHYKEFEQEFPNCLYRRIPFAFSIDIFKLVKDPNGRGGKSLDELITECRENKLVQQRKQQEEALERGRKAQHQQQKESISYTKEKKKSTKEVQIPPKPREEQPKRTADKVRTRKAKEGSESQS